MTVWAAPAYRQTGVVLPAFEPVRRLRPVDLVAPGLAQVELAEPGRESLTPCPQPAACAAIDAEVDGPAALVWASGEDRLIATYDGRGVRLEMETRAGRSVHRSTRYGRTRATVRRLALTLTGRQLTALVDEGAGWVGRARLDLAELPGAAIDLHDERWLAGLQAGHRGDVRTLRAGGFGQLGLRDLRVVSEPDGSAYLRDGRVLLTATSAGPGFFGTAHTSVWSLDPDSLDLAHLSDLYFRRGGGVYADHATHLLRDPDSPDGWLVATSTWADFPENRRRRTHARVGVTVARSRANLLTGRHVLDSEPLALPTDGLASAGVWDPHLVRDGTRWLVGYVSARNYFDFHPVLATGSSLDALSLRAAAMDRRATEGTTLLHDSDCDEWLVLASDGRDNPRGLRAAYPVFDLDLRQRGSLRSAYPSNLPWPTLVRLDDRWLHVAFDGTQTGGRLLGYGTHGNVVISRSVAADGPP